MKTNFHTHTIFCDGADTPEQLVQTALEKGFHALGFSGHSETFFDLSYCMSEGATRSYRADVARLKEQYAGRITLYCGVEQDYWSTASTTGYDFVIGSVHYLKMGDQYFPVDESGEMLLQWSRQYFDGDIYALIEAYYRTVSTLVEKTHADIIGHFDLITKFNESGALFDEQQPRYRAAALTAAESLLKTGKPFEINTGAMARGFRKTPYPSHFLVEFLATHGGKLVLSSDCHRREALDFGFDTILNQACAEGWNESICVDGIF